MSTQIAVRLPDDLVAYMDELVAAGEAGSRARLIAEAVERDRRRRAAERDAAIYAATEPDEEMNSIVRDTPRPSLDDLD